MFDEILRKSLMLPGASDCEDDDLDCGDIRRLLAATTCLLCGRQSLSRRYPSPVNPALLHRYLLVRYE